MSGNGEETVVNEQPHSVEISTNAKGDRSWKVKAYGGSPMAAKQAAITIDKQLEDHYRKKAEA